MLKLTFEVEQVDADVHEFELGHMILSDGKIEISSKNKSPNQAMMIFLSVSNLLFSVKTLFSSDKKEQAVFYADDSSFTVVFNKHKNGMVEILDNDGSAFIVNKNELINSIWSSVNQLYDKYAAVLIGSGAAKEDWDYAMDQYKNAFNLK